MFVAAMHTTVLNKEGSVNIHSPMSVCQYKVQLAKK